MTRTPLSQTITAVIGVGILLSLGSWQVQRLHWKNEMIATLERDYADMESNRSRFISNERLDELAQETQPMAIGKLRGHFLRDGAILLGPKPDDGRIGYHLLMPVELENKHTLIVNLGWVDGLWKDNLPDRLVVFPQETVTITGVLRKPDWNRFTSKNSPASDMWFRADIAEIAADKELDNTYPFLMYASAVQPPLHDVKPLEEHWLPRNKHLQYAIFWYAMAATLIAVYAFYWRSRKLARTSPTKT